MTATIHPETILRQLTELWASMAKEPGKDGVDGVLRACTMTLLVLAEEADDPQQIGETLAALMPEHPSRAIVVRCRASQERALTSRVFAQCWKPFGYQQQICCEQVEILASDASLPDVPAVVLPLAVADLPVILWCRSARLFGLSDFSGIAALTNKVVIDSGELGALPVSAASGWRLGDLAWTRLTRVRETISQIFESRESLARVGGTARISIAHGGKQAQPAAWYMGAWLQMALAQLGSAPKVEFESATSGDGLREIRLGDNGGALCEIRIDGRSLETRIDTRVTRTLLPETTDYTLMREELSIPGRDPIFEKVFPLAARLAAGGVTR